MWQRLGSSVIKYRLVLLIALLAITGIMGYFASKVKLSYEFGKAIPTDNPKYQDYVSFRKKFGDDGNVLVIAVKTDKFFQLDYFKAYNKMLAQLKQVHNVTSIISVPAAINLQKDTLTEKLKPVKIFNDSISTQSELDSAKKVFLNLPFYAGRLYNADSSCYLAGIGINKDSLNSPLRTKIVKDILACVETFEKNTNTETYRSGLPLIRTISSDRIQKEMRFFLIGSLVLSALILLLFFRSFSVTILSLLVVLIGVVWSVGFLYLCGFQLTILSALVPPLIVVIGIPNCIYFINKYHTSYLQNGDKKQALIEMVSKMGIVTLFCNITAGIGFGVFAFTSSAVLKEFGVVAGVSIMLIFVISFILLPAALSYLPVPGKAQTRYLNNKLVTSFLLRIERWVLNHKKVVYTTTAILLIAAIAGIFKLKTVGFIVDDLPKKDKLYTDLKFFEKNFKGVMPLEIVVETTKKNGLSGARGLTAFAKADSLAQYIAGMQNMNKPLSIAEGLKFAKQAFFDGDSAQYQMPSLYETAFLSDYLKTNKGDSSGSKNNFSKMLLSFMDSAKQSTRVSVSMKDIGTKELPLVLDSIQKKANELFDSTKYVYLEPNRKALYKLDTVISEIDSTISIDTAFSKFDTIPQYKVKLTGTSITFLEGSRFIINGLKESIMWAFLLISICMLYLFKSFRILLCSLIPNLIPLVITAGIMGWAGVPLKPSTVLVFSVALGIAIDITIRFLVNYKQELPAFNNNVEATVTSTIKHTGLSIVYTSLVLIAGFVIFCFSSFGGTFALGWLTSVTLLVATLTNLVLLPVLLLAVGKKKK
jgi:uncharacterized protein